MRGDCAAFICVLLASGCRNDDDMVFFGRSAWQEPIICEHYGFFNDSSDVTDVIPIGDTAFAALFADARELVTYDRFRNVRHTLRFDMAGPRGVRRAVSAAVSDSILFVADEGANLIKKFDRQGADRGTIRAPFIPRRVRLSGNRLLVTPLVAGSRPTELLFAVDDGEVKSLGGRIAQYEDVAINTLANMASLATFPTRAVVLHEMVVPFGYVFDLQHRRELRTRFAVPLSDAVRERVGRLPKPPLTERNVNELTVVAFVAASSVTNGRTYYVTRIGDGRRVPYRKLLVELDSTMQLRAVHPIDVNPHHMVYVGNPPALIAVDAESNWFECRLP
jgi:hypothetical protein